MDKFKTDEPVETNATENAIETKLVEPEEELYKPYKTNSIESCIETKNIKPKTEKVKSFVLEKKFDIEVDAEDNPKQHKNMKQKIQKADPRETRGCWCCLFSENQSEYGLGGTNITLCAQLS